MVKIRLARRGRRKLAVYDVVVADARAPRDGRFIEKLGTYNPLTVPAKIELNNDRAFHWLMQGAQPSDTVRVMLSSRGVMLRKHLQIGVVKGAITQEQADEKLAAWVNEKDQKVQTSTQKAAQTKEEQARARREAETKIREARAEAIRKKTEVAEAAAQEAEAPTEEAQAEAAPVDEAQAEVAPAAEAPTAEAPAVEAAPETPAQTAEEAPPADDKKAE